MWDASWRLAQLWSCIGQFLWPACGVTSIIITLPVNTNMPANLANYLPCVMADVFSLICIQKAIFHWPYNTFGQFDTLNGWRIQMDSITFNAIV